MSWRAYALALLGFNAVGALALYALQRVPGPAPAQPAGMAAVSPGSAFNTAVSFVTNAQLAGVYAGESTMSYLTQMLGLTVQNRAFRLLDTGIAVAFALIRGFASRGQAKAKAENGAPAADGLLGNFWADLDAHHPVGAAARCRQILRDLPGRPGRHPELRPLRRGAYRRDDHLLTFKVGTDGQPVLDAKGQPVTEDASTQGPDAGHGSRRLPGGHQDAGHQRRWIFPRELVTPYENPTPLSNFAQMLAIFLIPSRAVLRLRPCRGRHPPRLTILMR